MKFARLSRAAAAALCAFCCTSVLAGQFDVAPTRLQISQPDGHTVLRLSNRAYSEVHVQVRAFAWQQVNGEDVLQPTQALVVSPPIARIDPDGTQTVRVVSRASQAQTQEQSFRLLVDELPSPAGQQNAGGINVLLRYSVPVFVGDSQQLAAPKLSWRALRHAEGVELWAQNGGAQHAVLSDFTWRLSGQRLQPLGNGLMGYVLPGGQRRWLLKLDEPSQLHGLSELDVMFKLGGRTIEQRVTLAPRF